jgi:MFS family permease
MILLSQPLMLAILAPFTGRPSDRIEPRIVVFAGMALFIAPNNKAVMSSVIPRYYGVASATNGTTRSIGQTLSMSIVRCDSGDCGTRGNYGRTFSIVPNCRESIVRRFQRLMFGRNSCVINARQRQGVFEGELMLLRL